MPYTKTILVIEDDEAVLHAVTALLETYDYQVMSARNGQEALELLQKERVPDAILLDMRMPVMNGWQFAHEFRARHDRKAPIIVMTAASDAKQRANEIQAEAWLAKPFRIEEVLSVIQSLFSTKQRA